jgi:hypothetical protein
MQQSHFQALWFLGEKKFLYSVTSRKFCQIEVSKSFLIQPETLKVYSEKLGKLVEIEFPSIHVGPKPISCQLFSAFKRDGMVRNKCNRKHEFHLIS